MKKIYHLALPILLFVAACNSKQSTNSTQLADVENKTTSPFTDTIKLDTFKVSLKEAKSKGNTLIFKIISHQGKQIYQATIDTDPLLKDNEKLKTERDKMKFLKDQVKYFFEDEHFLWPAVMPDEKADKNVPDKAFHEELKRTQLNGFNYHTGAESKIYIAWSEKEQKVRVYYRL